MSEKKKNIIKYLIIGVVTLICVGILGYGLYIENDDVAVYSVIILVCIISYLLLELIEFIFKIQNRNSGRDNNSELKQMVLERIKSERMHEDDDDELKQMVANTAFDKVLKEGKDYTVIARVDNAILVKKVIRWQYFFVSNDKVNAVFSIETDKGVFCFQVNENRILFIPTNVMAELYPDIVPKGYKA